MSTVLPELILLELHFRTLLPINNLPHYHGAHWSALFRNIIKPYLPPEFNLAESGIWIHPVETGILAYEKDEGINLGMTFPVQNIPIMTRVFEDFNNIQRGEGHFQAGKTVLLEKVSCRITGEDWKPEDSCRFSMGLLSYEIFKLAELEDFTIHFHSPLRLHRPEGHKTEGHQFCDEDFFLHFNTADASLPLDHFLHKLCIRDAPYVLSIFSSEINCLQTAETKDLQISGGSLTWLDVPYSKTIGGVVGELTIKGRPTKEIAEMLVIGQYIGSGKNPTFGFGFYNIPELDAVRKVRHISRGQFLLKKAMSVKFLKNTLYKLPNSAPGPDMLTVDDIKKSGDRLLEILGKDVMEGTYRQGSLKKYRLPKDESTFREIHVQNVTDRLIHKTIADCLLPVIDNLLSNSSYAYRKGLNRKGAAAALRSALSEGYQSGIKADIEAFFDSVDITILGKILRGLFPFEPMIEAIKIILAEIRQLGINGLLQGSPLSPLLSNLYLNTFDNDMEKVGFRLIRYSDDFVVLFKDDVTDEEGVKKIEDSLSRLGLKLKPEKTVQVKQGTPIKFLGYLITATDITEAQRDKLDEEEQWAPVFKDEWLTGTPVYLTSICRGAYCSGPSLVVKTDDEHKEEVPWSRISRLVVIGRSSFTGGVVYRAVKEEIPVTFIDIMGRARGHLYPEHHELPDLVSLQEHHSKDEEACLAFAREIIAAKVHNSAVLLRRNSIDPQELSRMEIKIKRAESLDVLRGYEGIAAKIYFSELAKIVTPFEFRGRVYHPPDGPVNVMLSLGYTLLYNRLSSVLREKGFNPRRGFFHQGRGMHAALASDLLEELRHITERVVLSLIHRGEIRNEHFSIVNRKGGNICRLGGEGFRKYIHRFEVAMTTQSSYHGMGKMSCNSYLDQMADNLKRALKLKIPYRALRID